MKKLSLPLFAILAGITANSTAAVPIVDNFNDGNDDGWTRIDPIGVAAGGSFASYTFPSGGYRIEAAASPNPGVLGPGRPISLREDETFGDTRMTWDVVDWNDALPQVFGGLARISDVGIGIGTADGYAFVYGPFNSPGGTSGGLDLFVLENETVVGLAAPTIPINLLPTNDYRFVFTLSGSSLTGQVFDLTSGGQAIATISGTDATYGSGVTGLLTVAGTSPATADATFDNYFAAPEPASSTLSLFGLIFLLRRRLRIGADLDAEAPGQFLDAVAHPAAAALVIPTRVEVLAAEKSAAHTT